MQGKDGNGIGRAGIGINNIVVVQLPADIVEAISNKPGLFEAKCNLKFARGGVGTDGDQAVFHRGLLATGQVKSRL